MIVESDESNNQGEGSFIISNPLADLTVTEVRADREEYAEGENGSVTVTVKNQGARTVEEAMLRLTLGDFFSETLPAGGIRAATCRCFWRKTLTTSACWQCAWGRTGTRMW